MDQMDFAAKTVLSRDARASTIITVMSTAPPSEPAGSVRDTLVDLYWAGVRAVTPGPAVRAALARIPAAERGAPVWIIAIGKAAHPMADAAVTTLAEWGASPAGGVIVAPRALPAPHPALATVAGDHPVPGEGSFLAARTIGTTAARVREGDEVWVLLSGGATSLIAGPVKPVSPAELVALFELLLGSGLAIAEMNVIRKRFSQWGAGRLAVALAPARVRNYIISDVIGDDEGAIGSGPCVPDPTTAADVHALLDRAALWDRLPPTLQQQVVAAEHDSRLETPKPGAQAFRRVERRIIASNRVALEAIAARALALGYEPRIVDAALAGEASVAGAKLAATLATYCGEGGSTLPGQVGGTCLIWGGETTVTLAAEGGGSGGRCQELALAAARELAVRPGAHRATLLAAGTDGRDGATDAAGAIVDRTTWAAIARAGRDPTRDLHDHDSNPALGSVNALLRTDLTGTNVMDVIVGVCD